MSDPVTIRELSPERVDDYFALFDSAFPDNPEWAGCYCAFHDATPGQPFDVEDKDGNRAARTERICSGRARGILAYSGSAPVGWCQVAPRSAIPNLRNLAKAIEDPADDPAVIVCFVIPPEQRGRGIARALLSGAIDASRQWGVPWLEAYPDRPGAPTDAPTAAADSFRGPLALYQTAGFEIARGMGDWLVVRHHLAGASTSDAGGVER